MNKNRGLGKGLGALLPDFDEEQESQPQEIAVDQIVPNPYQPRKEFNQEKLNELAESIKVHGVIQPLLLRLTDGKYQLIAGERRLRAAKIAGLAVVPAVIREMSDADMTEVALVENLQREDLNPIEEADAYRRLMDEFHLTQDEIAKRVSKSRPAVANTLRLLNLPAEIQLDLSAGVLTVGHARALLGLKAIAELIRVSEQIKTKGLSVRETEELVRITNDPPVVSRETKPKKAKSQTEKEPDILAIEDDLQQALGTKVIIKTIGVSGKIEIEYYSEADLERICECIIKA